MYNQCTTLHKYLYIDASLSLKNMDTTLLKELVSIGFISSQTYKVWSISMKTDSLNKQK